MILIIGRNILISFVALILLPLVFMAVYSGTVVNQKMEQYTINNLGANSKAISLLYKISSKELEKAVIQEASELSAKNLPAGPFAVLSNDFNKRNSIDISLIIDKKEIANLKSLKPFLNKALKQSVTSTEIIPENFLKKYNINKLKLANNSKYLASIAQISATPVKNTDKVLVGIRFINQNKDLWNEISEIVKGRVLFIQKDYIISEIIKDQANEKSLIGAQISNDIYNQIKSHKSFTSTINLSNKNYVSVIEPLTNYEKIPVGAIFLAVSQSDFNNFKKQNLNLILITICAVAIIISVAAYIISQRLIESFDEIASVALAVKNGNLKKRVKIRAKDQIAQLGENINTMIKALEDRETKIKEYQKELHSQNERLKAIFNSLVDGIVTITSDCRIINVNPIVTIWAGLSEEEMIGHKLTDFIKCVCSVDCSNIDNEMPEICPLILQNERLSPNEAKIINFATGAEKLLGISSSQISGLEGEPTFVIVLRDITEIKEMESLRQDFIATLTHDLRVPILAEANTLKLYLKGAFGLYNEKQKEALENLLESNNDLLGLVSSLLDTYRYESGTSELYKEQVHIKKLVQDCIAELTPLAKRNNQSINNLISKEIPTINVDKNEIKRVLRNLISNSITYSPKGSPIDIDAVCENNELIVKVSDKGRGIPESEIDMIFDRYFTKAKKFRKIGTGLGLYLSKQIIEKHDGKIWVESELGKGSTFYFSLPVEIQINL